MSNFVNRTNDFLWFKEKVEIKNNHNKLFLICGKSGIGKSSFTDKLIKEKIKGYSCISIRFSSISNIGFSEGFFLQAIVSRLSECASEFNEFQNFKYYMMNLRTIGDSLKQYFLNVNGTLDNIMSYGLNDKVLQAFTDYLIFTLKENNIVLNVESFEMVDEYSLNVIKRIMNETSNNIFLLEYTHTDENDHFMYKLWDGLARENYGENYRYDLDRLKLDECIKIHNNKNQLPLENYDLIEKIYNHSKGNLYKIIHFNAEAHFTNEMYQSNNYDTTQLKLDSLADDAIYCLLTVSLNGYKIDRMLFDLIMLHQNFRFVSNIENVIESLENVDLIYCKGKDICIHDSVIKALESTSSFKSYYHLCYESVIDTYDELKSNTDLNSISQLNLTQKNIVINEIALYEKYDPRELLHMMDEVELLLISNYSEDLISNYLTALIKNLESFKNRRNRTVIENFILKYSYKLGLFENIQELYMTDLYVDSPIKLITYAMALGNLGDEEGAYSVASKIDNILKSEENVHLELLSKLVNQVNILTFKNKSEAVIYSKKLLNNTSYKVYGEYGLILRNYATRVEPIKAIPLLKKSIEHLKNQNFILDAAHTEITLAVRYAYTNQLVLSRECLNRVEKELRSYSYRTYYIFNNHAVLDIMENKCSLKTVSLLMFALQSVQDEYEKIIILSNLIACYFDMNDIDKAKKYFNVLITQNYKKYPNEDFQYLVHNTLINYSRITKNSILTEKYILEGVATLISDIENQNPFQDMVYKKFNGYDFGEIPITDPYFIEKTYLFDPGMLTHWGFEIPQEIKN